MVRAYCCVTPVGEKGRASVNEVIRVKHAAWYLGCGMCSVRLRCPVTVTCVVAKTVCAPH